MPTVSSVELDSLKSSSGNRGIMDAETFELFVHAKVISGQSKIRQRGITSFFETIFSFSPL